VVKLFVNRRSPFCLNMHISGTVTTRFIPVHSYLAIARDIHLANCMALTIYDSIKQATKRSSYSRTLDSSSR